MSFHKRRVGSQAILAIWASSKWPGVLQYLSSADAYLVPEQDCLAKDVWTMWERVDPQGSSHKAKTLEIEEFITTKVDEYQRLITIIETMKEIQAQENYPKVVEFITMSIVEADKRLKYYNI